MNEFIVSSFDIIGKITAILIFSYIIAIYIESKRSNKSKKKTLFDKGLEVIIDFITISICGISFYSFAIILYEIFTNGLW